VRGLVFAVTPPAALKTPAAVEAWPGPAPEKKPQLSAVDRMAQEQPALLGCLFLLVLVVGCGVFVSQVLPETAEGFERKDNRVLAVICAQSHIKEMLRAPRTAKWPGAMSGVDLRTHAVKLKDGTYAVESWVDAQNGFGALIRTRYALRLRLRHDGSSEVISAEFLK
jgi:hypothetical protein